MRQCLQSFRGNYAARQSARKDLAVNRNQGVMLATDGVQVHRRMPAEYNMAVFLSADHRIPHRISLCSYNKN